MDLKRILALLTELEQDGKITGLALPTLYDPNGDITLTVRAVDVATREQFLADVAGVTDEAEPEAEPHEAATVSAKAASKKAAKK